jgi:hypothetical protein
MDTQRVTRALAAYTRAEHQLADARDELHAAIVDSVTTGGRGAQAELARLTGYSRERIRQITRDSERAA